MELADVRLRDVLERFLAEDLGRGDVTSAAVLGREVRARGRLVAKEALVASGLDVAQEVFLLLDPNIDWRPAVGEGDRADRGGELARVAGSARALLAAERVALNLLQRMSGIATETRKFVEALAGTPCAVLDTRKTAPGLRRFDKQAVRAGGGRNHRFGLDDGILIKDNHLAVAGGVSRAVKAARENGPFGLRIEVEVENQAQAREALAAGADLLLLDNRTPAEVAALAAVCRAVDPGVRLEASGRITIDNVRAYGEAGVDFVSVGALTHSVKASDISLDLEIG